MITTAPFATEAPAADAATDKQVKFLTALLRGEGVAHSIDAGFIESHLSGLVSERATSKRAASEAIDAAKERGARPVWEPLITEAPALSDEELEGFWVLTDGRIVKVQIAVHGSGRPYGKVLDTETGRFEHTPGVVREVRAGAQRLTLDRARELGHLYGRCVRCGRTLTDEGSIEAGIGPVCAGKF
ncbi:hypothetical protein SEA_NHAGOS_40 [Gordonia phage NHagos]|nr:hypothetical protein SEA_NHAGOS_40 [Gordonia phage NHagos]